METGAYEVFLTLCHLELIMLIFSTTDEWRTAHPGAHIGLLEISGLDKHLPSDRLEQRKRQIETRLRERYQDFTRQDFQSLPLMSAYGRYYKRYDKTYHVLLQLESLVLKGKNLPNVNPLVDANFMAEVETLVLTAGHDAGKLHGPLRMDVSRTGDQMIRMGGSPKTLQAGDMIMCDTQGVACSIIYGQDERSPISAQTTHVLYVAYAPAGVPAESVQAQLGKILEHVRLFCPSGVLERQEVIAA
jgi:DNA/RNA-binding domain of Phe-tRNA-synthetase-like protein